MNFKINKTTSKIVFSKKMQQTTLVADQISSSTLKQKLQQENQQIHSQSKDMLSESFI